MEPALILRDESGVWPEGFGASMEPALILRDDSGTEVVREGQTVILTTSVPK